MDQKELVTGGHATCGGQYERQEELPAHRAYKNITPQVGFLAELGIKTGKAVILTVVSSASKRACSMATDWYHHVCCTEPSCSLQ